MRALKLLETKEVRAKMNQPRLEVELQVDGKKTKQAGKLATCISQTDTVTYGFFCTSSLHDAVVLVLLCVVETKVASGVLRRGNPPIHVLL